MPWTLFVPTQEVPGSSIEMETDKICRIFLSHCRQIPVQRINLSLNRSIDPFHVTSGSLLSNDLTTAGYTRWATDSVSK